MFMSKGKRYTEEFRREAVRQVVERGYSVGEVAERLDISTKILYHWRSKYHGSTNNKAVGDQAKIAKLNAELKRVTEERDILKKAAFKSQALRNTCPASPPRPFLQMGCPLKYRGNVLFNIV